MSVRPSIFLYAKNTENLGETGPPVPVFISTASDLKLLSPAERAITVGWHRPIEYRYVDSGGVFARVRADACARVCVHPSVRACVMCLPYTIIIFDPG